VGFRFHHALKGLLLLIFLIWFIFEKSEPFNETIRKQKRSE